MLPPPLGIVQSRDPLDRVKPVSRTRAVRPSSHMGAVGRRHLRVVFDAVGSEALPLWPGSTAAAWPCCSPPPIPNSPIPRRDTLGVDDYPHGFTPEVAAQLLYMVEELWGTERFVSIGAPSRSQNEGFWQRGPGSGVEFRDRGVHDLKGVPGAWRLFAVEGTRPEARREGWPPQEQR